MSQNEKPQTPPYNPPLDVEVDVDPTFVWRRDQLEAAGFEHFAAFRLALSGADYHEAIRLRDRGATDQQIIDLFLDD